MGGSVGHHQTNIPTWILLTPEDVPAVRGIDMGTGAERGFFGPTNKENAAGAKRSNFLTSNDEKIQRPKFGLKREKKRKAADDNPPPPPREDGHPSDYCRSLLPHISCARPKDYFDTQLTPEWLGWCTLAMNLRAYSSTHEFDRHRRPASWQLSAGPMDAAEEVVVGVFHLGNWGGRGECI